MRQLTLRVPDEIADPLKQAAGEADRSVNSFATAVLSAAVDPDLAGDDPARLRERLARAGLLAPVGPAHERPEPERLRRARRRAGEGRPLSELVAEDRR
jgi:hypothetical protein